MAAAAAAELEAVLSGQGWPVAGGGRCDAGPPGSPEPARLRRNTCFVVLAVVLNDQVGRWGPGGGGREGYPGSPSPTPPLRLPVLCCPQEEVLMTQEAKPECRGRWYLPAGRMEPRETAAEALRREVAEETGLRCQPVSLLAVEERGPAWIRLAFLARPTGAAQSREGTPRGCTRGGVRVGGEGVLSWCAPARACSGPHLALAVLLLLPGGTLKTLEAADEESLQARWWNRRAPDLPLRAADILPLMELALQYRARPAHPPVLPAELPCALICQRLLLVAVGPGEALWVLLGTAGGPHLPLAASGLSRAEQSQRLWGAVQRLLQQCLPQGQAAAVSLRGLLGLQHLGREPGHSDGICFNVVAAIGEPGQPPEEGPPALQSGAFTWWKVEDEALRSGLLQRLRANAFLPLRS